MKKIIQTFLTFILSIILVLSFSLNNAFQIHAEDEQKVILTNLNIDAKASLIVDVNSEQILHEQNATVSLPILSASKLLSSFVVFDKIKEGKIKLEDKVKISPQVASLSQDTLFSNVPLIEGQEYTVKELLEAGLVVSANGAISALAEKIAGGEKEFVALMKEKALALGLKNTFLFTTTGLSSSDVVPYGLNVDELGDNQMSAKDAAIMCIELIKAYPEIIEYTKLSSISFPRSENISTPQTYENVDEMLSDSGTSNAYDGVLGLKTGSSITDYSATFFGYYEKDGMKLVTILIGAKTKDSRFTETRKMLDFATTQLKYYVVANKDSQITAPQLALLKGNESKVEITTGSQIAVFTDQEKVNYTATFEPDNLHYSEYNKSYMAPIKAGDSMGNLVVEIPGVNYLRETKVHYKINMVSKKDYEASNTAFLQDIKDFITNVFR